MNDIESRLREFRPRRPAAIPDQRVALWRGRLWPAAAAGLTTALVVVVAMQTRPSPPQLPVQGATGVTLGALATMTRMAIESPAEFDSALTQMSRASLPDVGRPGGALQQLAKEYGE